MRKYLSIILAIAWLMAVSSFAFAQESKENAMEREKMKGAMMGDKVRMMERGKTMGMCPMHAMMMKQTMEREVIAASDGGVIVLIGNKLQKYDKDLVLKKEVEIKIDMEGMQKMMMQMKENCPMCKKMMEGGMMGDVKDESKEKEASSETPGHEAHH